MRASLALAKFNTYGYPTDRTFGLSANHFAAQGCLGTQGLSVLAFGDMAHKGGMVSLNTGAAGTNPNSVKCGPMAIIGKCMDPLGGAGTNGFNFTVNTNTPSAITLAGFGQSTSFSGLQAIISTGASTGAAVYFSTTNAVEITIAGGNPHTFGPPPTISLNTPYFVVYSANGSTANIGVVNLATGQTYTVTTAYAHAAGANASSWIVGNNAAQNLVGGLPCAMVSEQYLSIQQIQLWCSDSWKFWFPR